MSEEIEETCKVCGEKVVMMVQCRTGYCSQVHQAEGRAAEARASSRRVRSRKSNGATKPKAKAK